MGRLPCRRSDGKWDYTSAATATSEADFGVMEEYICRRENTVAQYIAT